MKILAGVLGSGLILLCLWDAFETIILPRRVTRRFRLARLFYRYTWLIYSAVGSSLLSGKAQRRLLQLLRSALAADTGRAVGARSGIRLRVCCTGQ